MAQDKPPFNKQVTSLECLNGTPNADIFFPTLLFALGLIIILNLVCFYRSLSGYFLADDFIHFAYLTDVFNNHFDKLLANFTGNWMQACGTQFYRPFISLTLAFDYWLGGGKPFWFHLSNLIFQIGTSWFFFLVCRYLFSTWGKEYKNVVSLLAACLFCVQPLHPEVVSWIIGRVDSVCLVFWLIAFWLYLKYRQDQNQIAIVGSIFAFALSLMSKEMAICLPPVLVLYEVILQESRGQLTPLAPTKAHSNSSTTTISPASEHLLLMNIKNSVIALRYTIPFWLMLGIYLALRSYFLGTVFGGYTGSIGEGFNTSHWQRLIEDGSLVRIFFSFNATIFSPWNKIRWYLFLTYLLSLAILSYQILVNDKRKKIFASLVFGTGWFILSLVPAYQVFNISDSLQCSRFAYFASAPLCFLLACTIAPFTLSRNNFSKKKWHPLSIISLATSVCLIYLYASICSKNNISWAHANDQIKSFRQALENTVKNLRPNALMVILNVPNTQEGAHVLYNAAMLHVLLSPPLSPPGLNNRVLSFEPPEFGDSSLLTIERLRQLRQDTRIQSFFFWDQKNKQLVPLQLPYKLFNGVPSSSFPHNISHACKYPVIMSFSTKELNSEIQQSKLQSPGFSIISPQLDLCALDIDFIELQCQFTKLDKTKLGLQPHYIRLTWSGDNKENSQQSLFLPALMDGQYHSYLFAVSEHKSWVDANIIKHLYFELPGKNSAILALRLLRGNTLMPLLKTNPHFLSCGLDGIYHLSNTKVPFILNAENLTGTKSLILEISKPNSWFEHYTGTLRDPMLSSHHLKTIEAKGNKASIELSCRDFPTPAYYELRAVALDASGKTIGFVSDPLYLQVSN